MAYHVKISLSKLCCEDGWQQRDIPGLKPQPCILTTNASVPQPTPAPSLAAWAPLVGQSGPAPGAQCWEKRKTQRKVAKATGEQWRLSGRQSMSQRVCLFASYLGPPGFWVCMGDVNAIPSLRSLFPGAAPWALGTIHCHPPLASGQTQPRALLGFSSSFLSGS